MKALEDLKAAFAAATPGEWVHTEGLTEDDYYVCRVGDFDFVTTDCSEWPDGDGAVLDAHLIALMHNALPALIECAEALNAIINIEGDKDFFALCDDSRAALAKLENVK